jgi:hypothetical protein
MYENKVNGHVGAGESLTGNMDFFTANTSVMILTAADATLGGANATVAAASQAALDKLVEVISLRGQPVLLGTPAAAGGRYLLSWASEHAGAWDATPTLANSIAAAGIDNGFTASNVTITVKGSL